MTTSENLGKIIAEQMKFKKANPIESEIYYADMLEGLRMYANEAEIVEDMPKKANVYKTKNFQYFTNGKEVKISNKFF